MLAAGGSWSNNGLQDNSQLDSERKPRQARKPSPGLAARLKALGFAGKETKVTSPPDDRIGRIPEDQISKLDRMHQNSTPTPSIQSRGRTWANNGGLLTPQVTGGSIKAQEDMDSYKYRLPEHTNENGTKSLGETKLAHIQRPLDISTEEEIPPPPISKDSPPEFSGDSYFNPFGLQRAGSVYTLSRVSFQNQLAQLTSLQLPDAELLSTKVSEIPTSIAASKALTLAAQQIRSWVTKATEVVTGLDGEDDIEWAAAGGREGLEDVDNAIIRFEELIKVYVSAIEALQLRKDIETVAAVELKGVVSQMENILRGWSRLKSSLKGVKSSVEIALEFEELWNTVLGDIGNEMDVLARLVFEMEEKRHKTLMAEAGGDNLDINDLETIVEETPSTKAKSHANRLSIVGSFPMSPSSPTPAPISQDDSSLLALFARMQPLRASLDFLPMRLSTFNARAEKSFPSACEELEERRAGLENNWASLEKDAESLRRELGEDRWVLVFRGAGRQAQKMIESVERSVAKLREGFDGGTHLDNPTSMAKRIESYEAKKMHYGPAIERVLSIIEKGVKDRLTVNGEILRLHSDMQHKWQGLRAEMGELDSSLDELQTDKKNQQLRDSVSSMLSNDRSTVGSLYDTPGSSPASSVVMSGLVGGLDPSTPAKKGQQRSGGKSHLPLSGGRRNVSVPANETFRPALKNRISSIGQPSPSSSPLAREGSETPKGNRLPRPTNAMDGKPRWNSSTNTTGVTGHNFKPLSLTTPSPHSKTKPPSAHSNRSNATPDSKIPLRSPLSRDNSSLVAESTPSRSSNSRLGFRDLASPGPYSQQVLARSSPGRPNHLKTQSSMSALTNTRRASYQPSSDLTDHSPKPARPASSLATNRRVSLLPQARGRLNLGVTGRESPQAVAGAANAMRNSSQNSGDTKASHKKAFRV